MNCPICNQVVESQAVDCRQCGEPLTTWRTLQASSAQVRQRGLHQAAQRDFLGATISFLEAAFANPLESDAWLDTARALVQLGQLEDAVRLLESVRRRAPQSDAATLIAAIRQMAREQAEQRQQSKAEAPDEPLESPAMTAVAAEIPNPACHAIEPEERAGSGSDEPLSDASMSDEVSPPADFVPQLRALLGLQPLARKRSFLQRFSGGSTDSLWESVLAVEARGNPGAIGGDGWLRQLAQHDIPHGAVLYLQGLDGWQKNDSASALQWFVKTVQVGTPYLNPVGYILCCTTGGTQEVSTCLRQLREFGIQPDEIRQVIQELRKRWGTSLPSENAEHLQQVEQINASMN